MASAGWRSCCFCPRHPSLYAAGEIWQHGQNLAGPDYIPQNLQSRTGTGIRIRPGMFPGTRGCFGSKSMPRLNRGRTSAEPAITQLGSTSFHCSYSLRPLSFNCRNLLSSIAFVKRSVFWLTISKQVQHTCSLTTNDTC